MYDPDLILHGEGPLCKVTHEADMYEDEPQGMITGASLTISDILLPVLRPSASSGQRTSGNRMADPARHPGPT